MKMIPDFPYQTNSTAEKKVFDDLRRVFPEQSNSRYTCFHSMNLTRHAHKRFGEADFIIACPEGLYVLEVKGGRIGCREGVWQSTDRNEQVHKFHESPLRQAETALHAKMAKLKEDMPTSMIRQLVIGYGVVFPDCELVCNGSEWDPQLIFDLGTRKSFEKWLGALFSYWRRKGPKLVRAEPETLRLLKQNLRPDFEAIIPLYALTGEAEDRIARLTEDQMALVDIVAANARVLCSGGAGTGKTFLAVELARRWVGGGLNVALVCRSPWLKNYLHSRYSVAGLIISTVTALKSVASRHGIDKYDALIVDEGQDLLTLENLDVLDAMVYGKLSEGQWCFFHDVNNQPGLFVDHDDDALQYLASLGAARVPLSTNCRNTKIILERIKSDIGADMGVKGAGAGPKVRQSIVSTIDEAVGVLSTEIDSIVGKGGLSLGQVTILAPCDFADSPVSRLPISLLDQISVLDEYSMQSFPPTKMSFSRIKEFKGLENEAIIVIGLPPPAENFESLSEHYVAMSRAKALLSIIYIRSPDD